MELSTIYTIIITLITVFGSTGAWRYYEKRISLKEKTDNLLKDDSRERIRKLEILLERSSEEKDNMRCEILRLTAEVHELRVRVEFLAQENNELRHSIK